MSQLKRLFISQSVENTPFDIANVATAMDKEKSLAGSSVSVSVEDFGSTDGEVAGNLQEMYRQMSSFLNDGENHLGFESFGDNIGNANERSRVVENSVLAMTLANIGSEDELGYRRACAKMMEVPETTAKNVITVKPQFDGPFGSISATQVATENYNEKASRDFRVVSAAYNLAASRQDAFGEAAYRTVVVNPTEGGITQNLTYVAVMQDRHHETTGALLDNGEVNMVEAYRDPSILEDKSNRLFPVVKADDSNKQIFSTRIAAKKVRDDHGIDLMTAPIRVNQGKFNLIGVSNFALLRQSELLDISDTIDPAMRLAEINLVVGGGDQVVRFMTERLPTAVFTPSYVDDTRKIVLNFSSEELILSGESATIDRTENAALKQIADNGWQVFLAMDVSANISTSRGDSSVMAHPATVTRVIDSTGAVLSMDDSNVKALIDELGDLEIDSVQFDARFTNTNRRRRGQLIQTRTYQFRYPIPMLSPITCPMDTLTDHGVGEVVKALTVAANIRNSANAVTRTLNYLAQLRDVTANGTAMVKPAFNRVEGALSIMMRPTYRYARLNMADAVDTIRGQDRFEDICATILNVARSLLYPAIRESNIKAAFRAVTGNADEKPKFIILTDEEIGNYLMTKGDPRALGSEIEFEVVTTNNKEFDGKFVMIPTRKGGKEEDILNWGQFYYVPTIVADLPISRFGQISREICAIPFNLHVNNIPFAIEIDIEGLSEVMSTASFTGAARKTNPVIGDTTRPTDGSEGDDASGDGSDPVTP